MKTLDKQVIHCWKPMEKYESKMDLDSENFMDMLDSPIASDIDALQKMRPNQFYIVSGCQLNTFLINPLTGKEADLRDTTLFQRYLEFLRGKGFDIGNNANSEYGYKMPLPKDGESTRRLIIFRRY